MADLVLQSLEDGIAVLTFNRPERLNALSYAMIDALTARLDACEADPGIRAVILTGAGERAFSAGADIPEFASGIDQGVDVAVREFVRRGQAMTARLEAFPKPVIAAVSRLAYGGGCEITEAVHLAMASERAVFAKPEIAIGIPPTFGGTQRLPRLVGRKRALELLLTGDPFPASRALELGIVNAVVRHEDLMPAAQALAARVLRHSPRVSAGIIAAVTRGLNATIGEGLLIEAEQFARLAPTRDTREVSAAWMARSRRD